MHERAERAPARASEASARTRGPAGPRPHIIIVLILLLAANVRCEDLVVPLLAPLSTVVEAKDAPMGDKRIEVELTVPADAPADLGIGAWTADRHGRWFQQFRPGTLPPGRHLLSMSLNAGDDLLAQSDLLAWTPDLSATSNRAGIVLWSGATSAARVVVHRLVAVATGAESGSEACVPALGELRLDGSVPDAGVCQVRAGERWNLSVLPRPLPDNPYDTDRFRLDLVVTEPDGREVGIPGFWDEPMDSHDRGDREDMTPAGPGCFRVRYRPLTPGRCRLRLEAVWSDGVVIRQALPDLEVTGAACDPFVRVDPQDPRFFSIAGRFHWPVGINTNSTYDVRCRDVCRTRLTPPRGSLVYRTLFERFAAVGIDTCEIWMSSWNLALEWRAEWPGYRGVGRFSQANANRLDRVLDDAWAHGIRINLVINNHGQASARSDREWKDNPWSTLAGGPLTESAQVFEAPVVRAGQERLRRYLIARYADHPAVLGWKLWSEVNLTGARGEAVVTWHDEAAKRWHALDVYRHPVSTHWAGDYRSVNQGIAALADIDYLCINAYRHGARDGAWAPVAPLLTASTTHATAGLHRWKKPILTTEYGGSAGQSPDGVRDADLRTAAWAAFVSGHGGSPMMWWWEWIDQGGRWAPFTAISRFIAGEDLRGAEAQGVALAAAAGSQALWAFGWYRPGRMLIYLQEPGWAGKGGDASTTTAARITIANDAKPGTMAWEWWHADQGVVIARGGIEHPGGRLEIALPPFAGHLAGKLWRVEAGAGAAGP